MQSIMPCYNRQASNELAASSRLDQLHELQAQLGKLIKDANPIPGDKEYGFDESTRPSVNVINLEPGERLSETVTVSGVLR
jgi:hypothetical protein